MINPPTACCLGHVMVQEPVCIQQAAGSIKLTHGSGLESGYCKWDCGPIVPVTGLVEGVASGGWMKQQADSFRGKTTKTLSLFLKCNWVTNLSRKEPPHIFHMWNSAKLWRIKTQDSFKLQDLKYNFKKCYFHIHWCYTTPLFPQICTYAAKGRNWYKRTYKYLWTKRHSFPTRMVYFVYDLLSWAVMSHYEIYELSLSKPLEGSLASIKVILLIAIPIFLCFSIHNIHIQAKIYLHLDCLYCEFLLTFSESDLYWGG